MSDHPPLLASCLPTLLKNWDAPAGQARQAEHSLCQELASTDTTHPYRKATASTRTDAQSGRSKNVCPTFLNPLLGKHINDRED